MKNVSAKWYDFGLLLGIGFNELEAWEAQHRGDANKCWNKVSDSLNYALAHALRVNNVLLGVNLLIRC